MNNVFLSFYLGLNCNLRCTYCNLEKDGENKIIINTLEDFEKVINYFILNGKKPSKILLSGGEPTLFKKEVERILIKYQFKYNFFIITNGVLINVIKELSNYNIKFIVSYDGHINDRGFDSFDTIKYLYDIKKLDSISMVISNSSYIHFEETLDELYRFFPDFFSKEATSNTYRGLDIGLVRAEDSYYSIDYEKFEIIMKRIYKKYPNLKIFQTNENNKLCKSFYSMDEDALCSHFTGELISEGCYKRLNVNSLNKLNDLYKECIKCDSIVCISKTCPISLSVLNVSNSEHPFCEMNRIITKIIKENKNERFIDDQFKNINLFEIVITESCNMKCKYCFQKELHNKNLISKDTIDKLLNLILKHRRNKPTILSLFGGEPISNYTLEIRKYLLHKIKELKMTDMITINITSNTYSISKEDIEWINDVKNTLNGRIYWQVSLDSIKEFNDLNRVNWNEEGTFDNVFKNILLLAPIITKEHLSMNSVINEDNIQGLALWAEFITNNLLSCVSSFRFRIDQTRNSHMTLNERILVQKEYKKVIDFFNQGKIHHSIVKSIFNLKRDFYNHDLVNKEDEFSSCGICNNFLTIDTNGDIIPCHIVDRTKSIDEYWIGNILTEKYSHNIEEIFKKFGSVEKQFSEYKNKYCYTCPLKLACVRCKLSQYNSNTDISKTLTYTCQYTHQIMDIYKDSNLYELFKPLSEDEKNEIRELVTNIKSDIDNKICSEMDYLSELNFLENLIEVKGWYI